MAIWLSVAIGYLSSREAICATNDFVQRAQSLALLINEQFRVTDDVDEEDVRNFQLDLFFTFGGHDYFGAREATIFSKRGSPRSGSQYGCRRSWP